MLIAFEGPDNVGKSTSAAALDYLGHPIYNLTKAQYDQAAGIDAADADTATIVSTFDRIDWFSHMVYRLAMPDRDWNDDRPRTVFAAPDLHLVIKLHHPEIVRFVKDPLYALGSPLTRANAMYRDMGFYFSALNASRDFELFKSVSMVEVRNAPDEQDYSQRLLGFSSAAVEAPPRYQKRVTDAELVELLRRATHES
jgi:hypothetical protein